MRRNKAFTLIELLVVISIIALLIGILLPALGAARRTARQMQNSTQVRGIHQGCVLYSQGNNSYYPGLTSTGTAAASVSSVASTTYGAGSQTVALTFALLLNGNYFTPAYAINPAESNALIVALTSQTNVTTSNYSYSHQQVSFATNDTGRVTEWKDNTNTQAPVLGDRGLNSTAEATGSNSVIAPSSIRSSWTTTDGDWRGSVVFGDNSTSFLTTETVTTTKFGVVTVTNDLLFGGTASSTAANTQDSLFVRY